MIKKMVYVFVAVFMLSNLQIFASDSMYGLEVKMSSINTKDNSDSLAAHFKESWCYLFKKAPKDYVIEDQLLASYMYKR